MGRNGTSNKLLLLILILTVCWPFTKVPRIYGDPNNDTRLLLHDDCQDMTKISYPYFSRPWLGDASANITEPPDRMLKFATYSKGGAILLQWKLDFDPGLSFRIGFDTSFQIINPGINTIMVLGLLDPHSFDDWNESGGFSYAHTNWPFDVVLNMSGHIGFQSWNANWNIPSPTTNYTIRVIIDPPKGEYWVTSISPISTTLHSGNASFSDLTLMDYFVIGFDGIGAEVVVSNIDVFYFKPFFEVFVPTPNDSGLIIVPAGTSYTSNVSITTDENLDDNFSLDVSNYSPFINCTLQPQSLNRSHESNLTIHTSPLTPNDTYPIRINATYVSANDITTRSFALKLKVANSYVTQLPLWGQQFFWTTLLAGVLAFAVSILFIRDERKLRTASLILPRPPEDKYLTCKNLSCKFAEIPLDSEYCPVCGTQLENN